MDCNELEGSLTVKLPPSLEIAPPQMFMNNGKMYGTTWRVHMKD